MHKITVQYFDPADGEAFEAAYRDRHVPLVKAVPGLERFTLSLPGADGAPYLVAELWFADDVALVAARSSAEMVAAANDAETYDVARRFTFAGAVEDL
ncbi:EthD family reductase [Nocardioides sp. YIM 152315]|uniref:EthD family reductase n=1 Tax=Nocardioides sp. YIM 152315 TaxID=3031760 RepID=UPI0023DBCF8A|nr:EthD family reductase [Nocardioides sp. YIM 152315]MDF1606504.1 EthD family reductase [Nocardioides sp. YIM 152315]